MLEMQNVKVNIRFILKLFKFTSIDNFPKFLVKHKLHKKDLNKKIYFL